MFEIEQEIIDRLKLKCGEHFSTICSSFAIAEFEDDSELTPYAQTFPPIIDLERSNCRDTVRFAMQWGVGVGVKSLPDAERTATAYRVAEGPVMAVINALQNWRPPSAVSMLEIIDIGPPLVGGSVTEYNITFRCRVEQRLSQ